MSVTENIPAGEKKEKEAPLTSVRKKIFVKHIWGKFQQRRWIVFAFFLTMFYTIPWLRLEGRPLLHFDIPARKFHIFNITLWPQDVYLLTLTLIFSAVALFFSTAIVGRVWCGYLCPQTVYTSVFIEIERLILGDSIKQKKLAKKPMKGEKLVRLAIRNLVWGLVAFSAGFTFLSYFIPNTEIISRLASWDLTGWAFFWLIFISAFAFFDFGFFREQFCFVPCPYGRFQGALQDPHSLVVTYDKKRGGYDPAVGKKNSPKGDCIDCNYCEIVCPTGIDIRNGAQFECISCARCIDACSVVMKKQGKPDGLIRYASENSFKGLKTKIIRPRILIYTTLLVGFFSFIGYQLYSRPGFDMEITRNRNLIYQEMPDGKISNMYSIKVMNMSNYDESYAFSLKGIDAELMAGSNPITVKSGEVQDLTLTLVATKSQFQGKVNKFSFLMEKTDKAGKKRKIEERSTFIIP